MIDIGRPEGRVEKHFIDTAVKNGYRYYKFTSPSQAGVPDRLIIGHGATLFVELKAPGETPRPLQREQFKRMRRAGAQVYVLDSKPRVNEFFDALNTQTDAETGLLSLDARLNTEEWRTRMSTFVWTEPEHRK